MVDDRHDVRQALSGSGACCQDVIGSGAGSADRLRDLLGAVAVYAAGGYRALTAYGEKKGGEVLRLTAQLQG